MEPPASEPTVGQPQRDARRPAAPPSAAGPRPIGIHGRSFWLALLAILALAAVLRGLHLEADPPHDLVYGGIAEYTDEGYKTYHARNRVLFGRWLWHPDDRNRFWIRHSPLSLGWHAAWFGLVGRVDVFSARLLHVIVSLGGILAWALLVRRERGDGVALGSAAILSGCFLGAMYDRLALLESLQLPFYAGLLWCLLGTGSRWGRLLGGLACATGAMLVKRSALLFIVAVAAAPVWLAVRARMEGARHSPRRARRLRGALFGAAALSLMVYLWLAANPEILAAVSPLAERSPIAAPLSVLRNLSYIQFATRIPGLLFLALIAAWWHIRDAATGPRRAATLPLVSAWSLLTGLVLLALVEGAGDRVRYYLFLLPAISILVAELVASVFSRSPATPTGIRGGAGLRAGAVAVGALAVVQLAVGLFHQVTGVTDRLALVRGVTAFPSAGDLARLIAFPAAVAVCFFPVLAVGRAIWRRGHRRTVVAVLLGLTLVVELRQWIPWFAAPVYQMQAVREDLARRLPPDAVLAGQWAPALTLGSRLRSLPIHVKVNIDDGQLRRLAPTHLLLNDDRPEERDLVMRLYPGLVGPDSEVASYRIARFVIHLHRLDWTRHTGGRRAP